MTEIICPICHTPKNDSTNWILGGSLFEIDCIRCGKFKIGKLAHIEINALDLSKEKRRWMACWIHEHKDVVVTNNHINEIIKVTPPSVDERAEKLLKFLAYNFPRLGSEFSLLNMVTESVQALCWCSNAREFIFLFWDYLALEKEFIYGEDPYKDSLGFPNFNTHSIDPFEEDLSSFTQLTIPNLKKYKITTKGWAFLNAKPNKESNIGFIAMSFDKTLDPLNDAIHKAIEAAGYIPRRIDRHHHNNRIDDEIIATLRKSRFIVADFTKQNRGAYFEAGYALGMGLEVVWTCNKVEIEENKVHFDTRQYNCIPWEKDKLEDFIQALKNRIEATI